MDDLISRQAAIDAFTGVVFLEPAQSAKKYIDGVIERIQNLPSAQPSISDCWGCKCPKMERLKERLPSAQPEPHWIPIKTRPMTDEERDYWSDHFGYDIGYENDTMFDCKMPEDQQPVWVQSNCGYVYEDVCENDDGMLGLEGNGDWSDIVAWMPKYVPEPWRGE